MKEVQIIYQSGGSKPTVPSTLVATGKGSTVRVAAMRATEHLVNQLARYTVPLAKGETLNVNLKRVS